MEIRAASPAHPASASRVTSCPTETRPSAALPPGGGCDPELEEVASALSGAYDSFAQNARDEATLAEMKRTGQETVNFYVHGAVRMHIVPIGDVVPQERPGRSFYVEQFMADSPEAPYRQRVYVLTRGEGGALLDRIYKIDNAADLVGAYDHPEKLAALSPEKLHPQDGCDMTFTKVAPDRWHGEAGMEGTCRSSYFGAFLHSRVDLTPDVLVSLDQGRSRSGGLIFGPNDDAGGYQFEKRSCYTFPVTSVKVP